MKATIATAAMLAAALGLQLGLPRVDEERRLAESLIGPAERLDLAGSPAFRSGDRAVLFFERLGEQSVIRGLLVVEGETIREVRVLRATEGPDRVALSRPGFLESFRGRAAKPPVVVQAISGATISSQAVIDAVNERIKAWRTE